LGGRVKSSLNLFHGNSPYSPIVVHGHGQHAYNVIILIILTIITHSGKLTDLQSVLLATSYYISFVGINSQIPGVHAGAEIV
jgi:hypothetical protein